MPEISHTGALGRLMRTGRSSVSFITTGDDIKQLGQDINQLLREPERVYDEDIGESRRLLVVRNNTIISPNGMYLGGARWKGYDSGEAALSDAEKLARGMSHKWASLNHMLALMVLNGDATLEEFNASRIGGGKSVIYDPHFDEKNLSAFGHPKLDVPLNSLEMRVLESIAPVVKSNGLYVFAPDMGTDVRHMDYISGLVPRANVACLSTEPPEMLGSGDASVVTARGVYEGILETVKNQFGSESLDGLTILVQGVGKVGGTLVGYVTENYPKVRLIIADDAKVDDAGKTKAQLKVEQLRELGIDARVVAGKDVYNEQFDVFSPNASGQILNPTNIEAMVRANPDKQLVIAGGANNQIKDETRDEVEALLRQYGILYAPDFVINSGGILNTIYESPSVRRVVFANGKYDQRVPLSRVKGVRMILDKIFTLHKKRGDPTQHLAERLAEEHIGRYAIFNELVRRGPSGLDTSALTQRKYMIR